MSVVEKIANEEGYKPDLYYCTEGYPSIGYGFNIDQVRMPREVADLWLRMIIDDLKVEFLKYPWFTKLVYPRQIVILDMAYQMGVSGVLKFKGMIAALSVHDYEKAAVELMDSKYARQTPNRAKRNRDIILTAVL